MNAFFGVLARFGNANTSKQKRIVNALEILTKKLKGSHIDDDIWDLGKLNEILDSADKGRFK